ncbi:hypothetical protein CI238_06517 [Colletotrichum incanum]|uniref:Uncharacterized protein n=1 Tax=Colletotrichum incanum TaxID=1573173 RepID=A0A167CXH8_COLIC|nr:hypothetical protein CI238_06517 [Colletotrichum incanum]
MLLTQLLKDRYGAVADESGVVDAERRLLYITNLDRWTILALIGSAPESLARLLGNFMLKYFGSRSSVGVSFSTDGPETFSLEFSFPLRVWRSTKNLVKDARTRNSDGEPLRSSRDMSKIRKLAGIQQDLDMVSGIYGGHISCIVTGYDQWRWTGILVLDTWFEQFFDNPTPDAVARYQNDLDDGMLWDPLSRGRDEAAKTSWFPRSFFIRIMEVRLTQVKHEWEGTIEELEKITKGLTEGPETFALEFSFPYWVWRKTKALKQDMNRVKDSDKGPLRSSRDVTFLRDLANPEVSEQDAEVLYSSHLSCIVTGYDQFRWTGIVFCESWFEEEVFNEPTPDSIARYEYDLQDVQESHDVSWLPDPLCRGKDDNAAKSRSKWLPRSYFIRVLEIRLDQIFQEWTGVLDNMELRIKGVAKRQKDLLQSMRKAARGSQAAANWKNALEDFEDIDDGFAPTKEVLRDLLQDIQAVVRSGDLFMTTDVNYFLNIQGHPVDGPDCLSHLSQIRKTFNKLRQLYQKLGDLQTTCKQMMKDGVAAKKKASPGC